MQKQNHEIAGITNFEITKCGDPLYVLVYKYVLLFSLLTFKEYDSFTLYALLSLYIHLEKFQSLSVANTISSFIDKWMIIITKVSFFSFTLSYSDVYCQIKYLFIQSVYKLLHGRYIFEI